MIKFVGGYNSHTHFNDALKQEGRGNENADGKRTVSI